ncbi:BgTH12-06155 [Blumeria graminis f. sp. triticale]|uniref:Bgt-51569 n=2 Tax=Blumeria graminis TaxID=34373 RepID=A0A9X9MKZ3_BLUGR|nr:BgTH12-06155 [Blumeria graminis f. sp. triticale]VDB91285.1 Bgt-51569 [Blumeria graminis f. sp. tritici]
MRFLVTASTAALGYLFLLVPSVLGGITYWCGPGEEFSSDLADFYARQAGSGQVLNGDPKSPDYEVYRAHRFYGTNNSREPRIYLVQVVSVEPRIRMWRSEKRGWRACTML